MKKILLLTFSFLMALMPLAADEVVKVSDVDIPESSSDVHFAKIKHYYPGDTVIISNFDTNVSVEVVVISDINENTDISLIISKKTADALEFIQGASYSVKIGKRQLTDKKVRGNAEISCSSTLEELTGLLKNKEILKKEPLSVKEENVTEWEEKIEQPVEILQKNESPAVEEKIEQSVEILQTESPVVEEKLEDPVPLIIPEEIPESKAEIKEEIPEELTEPEIEDLPVDESEIVEDVPEVEVVEQEDSESELVESELEESSSEFVLTDVEEIESFENEQSDEEVSESFIPETVGTLPEEKTAAEKDYSEKIVVDDIELIPEEKEVVEDEAEIAHITEVEILPELTEEKTVIETIEEEELEDVPLEPLKEKVPQLDEPEYYDAIILPEPEEEKLVTPVIVPLDEPEIEDVLVAVEKIQETPPEMEETFSEKETVVESETSETVEPAVVEVVETVPASEEKNDSPVEEKTSVEVKETKKTEKLFEKYIVKSESLNKSKYYIQIAAYKNEENIMEIVNKYGKKYPLSFVELSDNRGYKILVGPLSVDEYKVVLERFKSYGFKDAFVKKQ
ncbi:MAG: SPOR domain-containing protein [Spirochaetia bacterium]|nr:SPOR domain-containing protein [Spirochaetia bacterium]